MWKLLQGSAVIGVVWSNGVWAWTPNPYAAAVIGVGLAYGITAVGHWFLALAARVAAAGSQVTEGARGDPQLIRDVAHE